MVKDRGLLLFDADCGFCTASIAKLPWLRVDVDIAPMQSIDLLAHGVDEERARMQMPYVDGDGRVSYGHRAWAEVLRTGPWPCRLAGRLMVAKPVDKIAARAYHWVSTNRQRLPGGTATCALPPRS